MRRRVLLGGDDYEAVDLGVVSGGKKILWATMNVGAPSESTHGNYYQYGKGSRTYEQTSGETPYQGTENPLALTADTAHQLMGGGWRMPTNEECLRLTASTNYFWATLNGNYGVRFTSLTDSSKYIFLPAGGYWEYGEQNEKGLFGYYLTSSNNDEDGFYYFYVGNGQVGTSYPPRIIGCSVRGVKEVPLDESDTNGHAFVDLGLPSGTLWATMNVGASSESDYGNYYQYGKGSRTYQQTSGETEYQGTERQLALSADTAHQVWGGLWHMPTQEQLKELTDNTDYNVAGVDVVKFTSRTDSSKFIFLPLGGYMQNGSYYKVNFFGYYWSSTPYSVMHAYSLYFNNQGDESVIYKRRSFGYLVRPVIG